MSYHEWFTKCWQKFESNHLAMSIDGHASARWRVSHAPNSPHVERQSGN